jgi:hypothetical protein
MSDDLYDKYDKKPSSAGIPALLDPEQREDPDRPLRTEDLIPRHGSHNTPKIWLPDGSKMKYYGRPSGWGADADNSDRLKAWEVRTTVEGYLDTEQQGRTLRLERSQLPPPAEDKGGHDKINLRAKNLVFDADRQGTAKHSMTEKYDLGINFSVVEEYDYVLTEWVRLTKYMQIVDLPTGEPGIECFVAMDEQRLDQYGKPMFDRNGDPIMVRLAGTFDRFVRYIPCAICGLSNYILDLKTSSATGLLFAQRKSGIQLGAYSRSKLYVPWKDGRGATRYDLPDVCLHKGILVSIPPDAPGSVHWIDIARGFFRGVSLIPWIKEHQKETDWMREFIPVPNIWAEIDRAQTEAEVRALWRQYPGVQWEENQGALSLYASKRITEIIFAERTTV